jgi:hypothetical protein
MTGVVRTLGYAHPVAATMLVAFMVRDPTTLLVDIRFCPRSHIRGRPDKLSKELSTATSLSYRYPIKLCCKPMKR